MTCYPDISTYLNWRYAVRQFSDKKVSQQCLAQLLTMTGLSASSYGLQPYKIIVIENPALKKTLVAHSCGQEKVSTNSHLLIFAADMSDIRTMIQHYFSVFSHVSTISAPKMKVMEENMRDALTAMTAEQQFHWASQQVNIALGTFLVSAASLGVDSCPVGGIDTKAYDDVLKLGEQHLKTVLACPIGYRHRNDQSADAVKVRKPLSELVLNITS
ncbi:NAD(P)H-dependent oxidoreductase [Pseudoalteromonas sp. MMG012]|uniref:NAD(P)H-dependent oxidoreductase n=1 Tax=Pseudoalteromonas sp. MMG012 TaxID=2822686 RepID=UPI001B3A0DE6|nr:NAD(P)H-dependent oxidoreductase [Pseudoalteromonas sp. MMG012]MBQ4849667.1 NAD(P)H-dependent oxidoreductase [Pseudoalteromonas sp. MMG012]